MVSLYKWDVEESENEEKQRKKEHDQALERNGIVDGERYPWGEISSDYDPKGHVSNINIVYF